MLGDIDEAWEEMKYLRPDLSDLNELGQFVEYFEDPWINKNVILIEMNGKFGIPIFLELIILLRHYHKTNGLDIS